MSRATRSITPVIIVPAILAVALLSGCATGGGTDASSTPTSSANGSATPTSTPSTTDTPGATTAPTSTSTPSPTASATATATSAPSPAPTAVSLSCTTLITLDQLYAFNPNYGVAPSYKPSAGSPATAVSYKGTSCGWSNQSSGEVIEIAVAKPGDLAAVQKKAAASFSPTDAYGSAPAYFSRTGDVGEAQIFTNGYWVVAKSGAFFVAQDATELVGDAVGNLP